ncbi:MAG: Crp/Fnr family transcriptional regulator [Acidobacteria bacterium]|nr:Crp/Fnr family transcriptional regulator [Acidobacteriota bacterium]
MKNQINFPETFTRSDFFSGIDEHEVSAIIRSGHQVVFKSGSTLFRQGMPARKLYLVEKGRLKLSKLHRDGKEIIVRYINPGQITAAVAAFSEKELPATAQTVGSTEVIEWTRESILRIMGKYPRLAINMLHAALERLDDIQNRYLELTVERVEQRVARALLRIMKQSSHKTEEGIHIDFRLSRQNLADYTGTTLFTVSRILSDWERKGWISSGRERIAVTDPHALVTLAETG